MLSYSPLPRALYGIIEYIYMTSIDTMQDKLRLYLIYLIDFLFGIIEILIGIRFFLKLLGARPTSDFVSWIYLNTQGLIHPFEGAFPTPVFHGGVSIEFSSLLALMVYGVIGYFLLDILTIPEKKDLS